MKHLALYFVKHSTVAVSLAAALFASACGSAPQQTVADSGEKKPCCDKSAAEKADCCGGKGAAPAGPAAATVPGQEAAGAPGQAATGAPGPAGAGGTGCCADKNAAAAEAEPFKRIDLAGLKKKLDAREQIHVFDANSQARYDAGHIPGAIAMTKATIKPEALPANKDAMLVFYCGSPKCMASHDVARAAIGLGYTNVWILPDGIKGWEGAGLPTEKATVRGAAAQ